MIHLCVTPNQTDASEKGQILKKVLAGFISQILLKRVKIQKKTIPMGRTAQHCYMASTWHTRFGITLSSPTYPNHRLSSVSAFAPALSIRDRAPPQGTGQSIKARRP
jgi:hypothetical protein